MLHFCGQNKTVQYDALHFCYDTLRFLQNTHDRQSLAPCLWRWTIKVLISVQNVMNTLKLLTHWSYAFLALTHQYGVMINHAVMKSQGYIVIFFLVHSQAKPIDLFVKIQYIPRNMHTVFALLCFVVVIHWLIFPYPSGLLHWHCGNLMIAPVPAKQPWWIWINTSCEFIMNDCITTTKQSTTKPCAYFLGYTVGHSFISQCDLCPSFLCHFCVVCDVVSYQTMV